MTHTKRFFSLILLSVSCIVSFAQTASIQVDQLSRNHYAITVKPDLLKSSSFEWNAKPDTWNGAMPLALKTASDKVEINAAHPIVKLKTSNAKSVYASPRGITLEGANNFRDLGGYVGKDGRQVKWGKIYRSGDVSKLTDEDLKTLSSLNIKMVCDLRGPIEIEASPDRLPEGTTWINLPAGSEQVGGANSFLKYMKTPDTADSMMMAFYTRNDHYKAKYKPMFDQLLGLENDYALMFHCAGGKDRTGVGAALILYALGVSESDIYRDYELTNEFRKDINEPAVKKYMNEGLSEKAARAMMAADPKYLKAAFESLTKKYGTVDKFLEMEMELTAEKRNMLQAKLLY